MSFSNPILERPITSKRRIAAPPSMFGNLRRSGPTPIGSAISCLSSILPTSCYPTNELPISKASPQRWEKCQPIRPGGCSLLNSTARRLGFKARRLGPAAGRVRPPCVSRQADCSYSSVRGWSCHLAAFKKPCKGAESTETGLAATSLDRRPR